LDQRTDEVGVRMVFPVQYDVWSEFAHAESPFASFLACGRSSGTVRARRLAASKGICQSSIVIPWGRAGADKTAKLGQRPVQEHTLDAAIGCGRG
jgi:hypothetical protein